MADPVLAPAATIAAFVMAVLSWYGMLRTGIDTVYKDSQAIRTSKTTWNIISRDLDKLREDLQEWQRNWMTWSDQIPDDFYDVFWRPEKCHEIKGRMKDTQNMLGEAMKELGIKENKKPWLISKLIKATTAIVKAEHLQKIIERLNKQKDLLHEVANKSWNERRGYNLAKKVNFSEVHDRGAEELLLRYANHLGGYTKALMAFLKEAGRGLIIEMEPDPFNGFRKHGAHDVEVSHSLSVEEKWLRTVVEYCTEQSLNISILARPKGPEYGDQLSRILVANAATGDNTEDAGIYPILAFSKLAKNKAREVYYRGDADVVFKMSTCKTVHRRNTESRTSWRSLLSQNSAPEYENSDLLGNPSKFRIVFELAQMCFLFLQSSTLTETLCSCYLRCGSLAEATTGTKECALQFGLQMHEYPRYGDANIAYPAWCQPLNTPVANQWNIFQRLGIIALEIILGRSVNAVTTDDNGKVTFVNFLYGSPPSGWNFPVELVKLSVRGLSTGGGPAPQTTWQQVNQKYRPGERYAEAIIECFELKIPDPPTEAAWHALRGKFYNDVLLVFKDFYFTVVTRHTQG